MAFCSQNFCIYVTPTEEDFAYMVIYFSEEDGGSNVLLMWSLQILILPPKSLRFMATIFINSFGT